MLPRAAARSQPRSLADISFGSSMNVPKPTVSLDAMHKSDESRVASVTQDLFGAYASRAAAMETQIATLTAELEASSERDRLEELLGRSTRELEDEKRESRASRRLVDELTSALRRCAWDGDFREEEDRVNALVRGYGDEGEGHRHRGEDLYLDRREDSSDEERGFSYGEAPSTPTRSGRAGRRPGGLAGRDEDGRSPPRSEGRRRAKRTALMGQRLRQALEGWRERRDSSLLEVQEGRAAARAPGTAAPRSPPSAAGPAAPASSRRPPRARRAAPAARGTRASPLWGPRGRIRRARRGAAGTTTTCKSRGTGCGRRWRGRCSRVGRPSGASRRP